jgi:hypothetical protein
MRPLSYEIVANATIKWLDMRFNVVSGFGFRDDELELFLRGPRLMERLAIRLRIAGRPMIFARNRQLARIYKRLLDESYFLHFAGRQQDMALLR